MATVDKIGNFDRKFYKITKNVLHQTAKYLDKTGDKMKNTSFLTPETQQKLAQKVDEAIQKVQSFGKRVKNFFKK